MIRLLFFTPLTGADLAAFSARAVPFLRTPSVGVFRGVFVTLRAVRDRSPLDTDVLTALDRIRTILLGGTPRKVAPVVVQKVVIKMTNMKSSLWRWPHVRPDNQLVHPTMGVVELDHDTALGSYPSGQNFARLVPTIRDNFGAIVIDVDVIESSNWSKGHKIEHTPSVRN